MPKVELELELEQVARILERLSPGELETLELLLNPELRAELKGRWQSARTELKEGKTLSKKEKSNGEANFREIINRPF